MAVPLDFVKPLYHTNSNNKIFSFFLEIKIGVTPVQSLQFSSRSLPSCKTKQTKLKQNKTKQNEKTETKTKRVRLRCSETAAQSYRVL